MEVLGWQDGGDAEQRRALPQSCFLRKASWQPPQPSLPSAAKAASVALTSPPCEVSASLPANPCARSAACLNWSCLSQITGSAAVGVCVLPGGNISGTYSAASAIAWAWNATSLMSCGFSLRIALIAFMCLALASMVAWRTATTPLAPSCWAAASEASPRLMAAANRTMRFACDMLLLPDRSPMAWVGTPEAAPWMTRGQSHPARSRGAPDWEAAGPRLGPWE